MTARNWLITGVGSGFGRELATQLLDRGDTVRRPDSVADLVQKYPDAQVAQSLPAYDDTPAHGFLKMLDPANGLAAGDPARMAAAIIASVDQQPAPLRIMLGSQALQTTVGVLKDRVASFEAQADLAASTDFPPGE